MNTFLADDTSIATHNHSYMSFRIVWQTREKIKGHERAKEPEIESYRLELDIAKGRELELEDERF